MKRLILILVFLLLLAGGGAAGWMLLHNRNFSAELPRTGAPGKQVPLFVDFDPLVLPVIRDGKVTHHLTFTITLEIDPAYDRIAIYDQKVRLKDAYFAELHALYSHRLVQDRKNVVPLLKKRLLAVSRRLLGEQTVDQVLVNVLQQRDLTAG